MFYRLPAEWEEQKSTLIAWPYNKNDWPKRFDNIPSVFAKIISKISYYQKVNVLIKSNSSKKKISFLLKSFKTKFKNIRYIICKTDRVWIRDTGPIFLKDKKNKNVLCNWKFNGWAKYADHKNDDRINIKISKYFKGRIINPLFKKKRVVLEGGSIDVNGKGLMLTTRECLLSKIQQRNSNLKINDYHSVFKKYFGIHHIIWLNRGIVGDDTHGHIDDIARFVSPNKIFLAYEKNKNDKNYKMLNKNFMLLKKERKNVSNLKIERIPMPRPIYIDNTRVPASYLNFYITNKLVLLPVFNDPNDKVVIRIFKKEFKNRKVVPIDCSELIWGLGAIHCMTQQEPR